MSHMQLVRALTSCLPMMMKALAERTLLIAVGDRHADFAEESPGSSGEVWDACSCSK